MIIVYSGCVGSGKTLKAVCDCISYLKSNEKVYANQYIQGTFLLPANWYDFKYDFGSLLIIDEAQLKYNCRNMNTKQQQEIDKKVLAYLTMCRHYGLDILFITQSLTRLDVQIRELATVIYHFKKTIKLPYFSLKQKKIKWLPVLQIGRAFDDSMELQHYMTSANPSDFGRLYLCLVRFKALKMYDTHTVDSDYIAKEKAEDCEQPDVFWRGFRVC